jgi:uncharacterized protein (UPF0371 family)
MKLIDDIREWDLEVSSVVITRYDDQPSARLFKNKLERRGVRVYLHRATKGYPTDVDRIVSDEGYGANPYIETSKPLVVVTGPGPGSGKLATCLSQMYHEHKRGISAGYAKFETFPIWNLPLKHPVNVAYEAATLDLEDVNQIDSFHLEAYDQRAVNYNRDMEAFPVLQRILERLLGGESLYRSPTDMGVNRAGFGIVDDKAVREAACQEVVRRYFRALCEYAMGITEKTAVNRAEILMNQLSLKPEDRAVVQPARAAANAARECGKGNEGVFCGAALQLPGGDIICGKNSPLMHAASSLVLNAAKCMAGIPDQIHLLPPNIIEAIAEMKTEVMNRKSLSLDLDETLIALSISGTANPAAALAVEKLKDLRGCEVHISHIPTRGDEAGLRRLGVNLTSDPAFSTKNLFMS